MRIRNRCATVCLAVSVAMVFGARAQADVVNFTDGNFTVITPSGIGNAPTVFSETVLGATLTFESTVNLVGTERFLGLEQGMTSNGLHLGGGGGSTLQFTVSSDQDIQFLSYATDGGGGFLGDRTFDISGLGASSIGNSLAPGNPTNLVAGGPITLLANEVYTFDIQNGGAADQAFISSFDVQAAVPEPGSASILLMTVLGTRLMRRRRK